MSDKPLFQLTVGELRDIIKETLSQAPRSNAEKSEAIISVYRRSDLAKLFGVTVQTINAWVKTGQLPKPTKVGRIPVFSHEQIKHLLKTTP